MGSRRTRLMMLAAAVAVVAAACGDSGVPATIDLGAPATEAPATEAPVTEAPATQAPGTTQPPATEGTAPATTQDTTGRQRPEGPDAPDFELALGGPGGTFVLSEETKPVFLIFWAEW